MTALVVERALTLWQPWAEPVVDGIKPIENRPKPWPLTVPLPARIGIHAGQFHSHTRFRREQDKLRDVLRAAGYSSEHPQYWSWEVTFGALLGFVTVVSFHHADQCWEFDDRRLIGPGPEGFHCSAFGFPDQYHYVLEDAVRLAQPVRMRGWQGLWRLPADVAVAA